MSCGCHCGSIRTIPAAAPVSPQEVVPADNIVAGWDAAVRVDTAGAVSVLPDVSGNGFNLEQAVGANQPTVVVGGGPNGNDSILFDGIDDFMRNAALTLPAPGTTPSTFWGVFRQVTWTSGDVLFHPGGGMYIVQDIPPSPNLVQFNGALANLNGGMTVGSYMIFETFFSNSISDFILVGGSLISGTNAGNTIPIAGFNIGRNNDTGVGFSNIELCELWLFSTLLTAQQRAGLRAYATAKYGPIL